MRLYSDEDVMSVCLCQLHSAVAYSCPERHDM